MPAPGTGIDGRPDLPAERGFRFFPGFYKHVPDTMRRIPSGSSPHCVFDQLVSSTRAEIARIGAKVGVADHALALPRAGSETTSAILQPGRLVGDS